VGRPGLSGASIRALSETAPVFGHCHRDEEISERIDHQTTGVFIADDGERLESPARHLAPDFMYVSPEVVFEGPPGLSDAFARPRDRGRPTSVGRTSPVDIHHGYFP
jgi:hypothetical protein